MMFPSSPLLSAPVFCYLNYPEAFVHIFSHTCLASITDSLLACHTISVPPQKERLCDELKEGLQGRLNHLKGNC